MNTKISKTVRPASPTTSTDATFKFSCTAAPCTYKCKLNTNPWAKCKSPKTYTILTPRDHTFSVKASSNGRTDRTPASFTWHIGDIWAATSHTGAPGGRSNTTLVWTGAKVIMWGGSYLDATTHFFNTGGIYDPASDSWTATSTDNAPTARYLHTAVWTAGLVTPVMIVWGGHDGAISLATGGRYNPATDSWVATYATTAPTARYNHTAVWTGTEMIVWGDSGSGRTNTGGRYNPSDDSWMATSTSNAPTARELHTAVWTESRMVVWGGLGTTGQVNTGGRYNPSGDSWTATSATNAPDIRFQHTAVWAGAKMIIWGGAINSPSWVYRDTGGVYDPELDSWTATSTTNVPAARKSHAAVWTGTEMIVWGGDNSSSLNTGGRYNPVTDSWTATSLTNAPAGRSLPGAVWAGDLMIIWGGRDAIIDGARYWP